MRRYTYQNGNTNIHVKRNFRLTLTHRKYSFHTTQASSETKSHFFAKLNIINKITHDVRFPTVYRRMYCRKLLFDIPFALAISHFFRIPFVKTKSYNWKNGVSAFSWLVFIRSVLTLRVSRTYMSRMTSIRHTTTGLAAHERQKNLHRLILEKQCLHIFSAFLIGSFSYLRDVLVTMTYIKLGEFKIRPNLTTDYRILCPWASKKIDVSTFPVLHFTLHWLCQYFAPSLENTSSLEIKFISLQQW